MKKTGLTKLVSYGKITLCGHGGIGRRAGFRIQWDTVQVQVLLPAEPHRLCKKFAKKVQKTFVPPLTESVRCGIITGSQRSDGENRSENKKFKKPEKSLKNLLTSEIGCDIIYRLSARQRSENRSLKIEQQCTKRKTPKILLNLAYLE